MDWLFKGSQSFDLAKSRYVVEFSRTLRRSVIAVDIDSEQNKNSWFRAGNVSQALILPEFDGLVEVADSNKSVGFSLSLVKFAEMDGNDYKLRFLPVPWLTKFSVTVYEYMGE